MAGTLQPKSPFRRLFGRGHVCSEGDPENRRAVPRALVYPKFRMKCSHVKAPGNAISGFRSGYVEHTEYRPRESMPTWLTSTQVKVVYHLAQTVRNETTQTTTTGIDITFPSHKSWGRTLLRHTAAHMDDEEGHGTARDARRGEGEEEKAAEEDVVTRRQGRRQLPEGPQDAGVDAVVELRKQEGAVGGGRQSG